MPPSSHSPTPRRLRAGDVDLARRCFDNTRRDLLLERILELANAVNRARDLATSIVADFNHGRLDTIQSGALKAVSTTLDDATARVLYPLLRSL